MPYENSNAFIEFCMCKYRLAVPATVSGLTD
jgi:hypothetical protein